MLLLPKGIWQCLSHSRYSFATSHDERKAQVRKLQLIMLNLASFAHESQDVTPKAKSRQRMWKANKRMKLFLRDQIMDVNRCSRSIQIS